MERSHCRSLGGCLFLVFLLLRQVFYFRTAAQCRSPGNRLRPNPQGSKHLSPLPAPRRPSRPPGRLAALPSPPPTSNPPPRNARALPGQQQARPGRAPAALGRARAPPALLARARARGRGGAPLLPAAGVAGAGGGGAEEAEAGPAAGSGRARAGKRGGGGPKASGWGSWAPQDRVPGADCAGGGRARCVSEVGTLRPRPGARRPRPRA